MIDPTLPADLLKAMAARPDLMSKARELGQAMKDHLEATDPALCERVGVVVDALNPSAFGRGLASRTIAALGGV